MSKLFIPSVPDITKMHTRVAPPRQTKEQAAASVGYRAGAIWQEVLFNRPSEERKSALRSEILALVGL
ncbi:hypothetical protein [Paraburkholderia ginsengisoli]|uniref:Uncharacterized protein n=1 Tax=Paraburkholderia ginsengisoli TaxID=311231 RepID=A0A7T4T987_9BURK|nr:hypothetical protein [Paraburkholderia ginsengisoli]QQC64489.1 hypothetical protein I6I06_03125 [Paraburkholderia ginsengisoli]